MQGKEHSFVEDREECEQVLVDGDAWTGDAWSLLHHRATLPRTDWLVYSQRQEPYEPETQAAREFVLGEVERGSRSDMVELGLALMQGEATFEQSLERGRALLVKAADLGYARAMAIVGVGHVLGVGFAEDRRLGWVWIKRAAAAGDTGCVVELERRRAYATFLSTSTALLIGGLAATTVWWGGWMVLWGVLALGLGVSVFWHFLSRYFEHLDDVYDLFGGCRLDR